MTKLLSPRTGAHPIADLGERSVLVAGQRVGRARRRRARRIAAARRAIGVALAVLIMASALGFTAHWLLTSPRFTVADVEVRGASRVAPGRILAAAGVEPGTNVFRLRPREIVARVEALPEVRRAEVIRELPGHVAIQVEERRPFTMVVVSQAGEAASQLPRPGRLVWVDEEGLFIGEERQAVVPAAPLISGVDETELSPSRPEAGPRTRAAIAVIRSLLRSGSALSDEISEVDMGGPDGPILRTVGGIDVHLGSKEWSGDEWPDRLARLEGVLAQVAAQDPHVNVVDLRFKDQVVLRRGGQPSDGRRPKS